MVVHGNSTSAGDHAAELLDVDSSGVGQDGDAATWAAQVSATVSTPSRSSYTPTANTTIAAGDRCQRRPGSGRKIISGVEFKQEKQRKGHHNARVTAMRPNRGGGLVWTARSPGCWTSPDRTNKLRTKGVSRKHDRKAATPSNSREYIAIVLN